MSILLVTPIDAERDDYSRILRDGGYADIILAISGIDAIQKLGLSAGNLSEDSKLLGVDLIILDVDRPEVPIDTCMVIKNHPQFHDLPILILSHDQSADTMQMAFALGAVDFVIKPVRDHEFLASVPSPVRNTPDRR